MEVVGIGQLHLTAELFQIVSGHCSLDGPLGTDVHKHWGLDHAVCTGKGSPAGSPLFFQHFKHAKTPFIIFFD